jgi:hypothetical protein
MPHVIFVILPLLPVRLLLPLLLVLLLVLPLLPVRLLLSLLLILLLVRPFLPLLLVLLLVLCIDINTLVAALCMDGKTPALTALVLTSTTTVVVTLSAQTRD